jgi:hypothetical protein
MKLLMAQRGDSAHEAVIAGGNNYFGNRNCTSSSKVHLEASVGAATL